MKVLNFGSINYDKVYRLNHIVVPGETISSQSFNTFFGGKGLNQACAIAKAGVKPYFAGMVGSDGDSIIEMCDANGIDRSFVSRVEGSTGHAIIQVSGTGENSIIICGGANEKNSKDHVDEVLSAFDSGDIIVLQNEINCLDYIVDEAYKKGMTVILNPSPFDEKLSCIDINMISILVMNEIEGFQMTGETEPERILDKLRSTYLKTDVVLTLGSKGSIYMKGDEKYFVGSYEVVAVDTTAAGDTFTGYFVAGLAAGMEAEMIMKRASYAAAIAVSREGAIPSIPSIEEVEEGKWH